MKSILYHILEDKMGFENDLSKNYLQTLKRHYPLTESELHTLIHKAHAGDKKAFNKVFQANLRFVISVAATFRNSDLSFDERVAEGNLGLMRAVEKFDPDRGYKFTTYAVWWIRQAIQKAIWRNKHPFHRPLNQFEDWDRIRRKTDQMAQNTGQSPTMSDVGNALAMTPQRLEAALDTQIHTTSLDTPTIESGPTIAECLADDQTDPLHLLETKESAEGIQGALAKLPPRDAEVISLTFGLNEDALSFSMVGKRLGISKERVRQLRNRALANLRAHLHKFSPEEAESRTDNAVAFSVAKNKSAIDKICA
jgi:RNA polymerase sigma factor (sigma-70 family)